jgi:predicted nuclease of predicted toxin-antitoxin system
VRLLIDANLSPKVTAALRKARLESVHVGDVGLLTAPDRAILDYAAANAQVIVSADSDFGELLAAARGRRNPRSSSSAPPTGLRQTSRQRCPRRTCQRSQTT